MLIFLHQLSKKVRNCNRFFFFIEKICFKSEERTAKKGRFQRLSQQIIFFKKNGLKIIFLHTAEAVAGRCSVKKVLLEIWRNWQSLSATLLKKKLWRRCFPVNFAKFLRTLFLIEHLGWLLLTLEFLKIVFSSVGSPKLQLQPICLNYYRIV